MPLGGAEQTVVTDLDESLREHVLEEATNELFSGDGATLELVSGRFFVRESDRAVLQFKDAVIAEGDAKDVRGEILESGEASADGFGVDHPSFAPDERLDLSKQFRLFQFVAKLGAENGRERFNGDEEVWA